MSDLVKLEINEHVADIRLNRPDRMNALNLAMFTAITEAGKAIASNTAVRAVVISGEGRAFCSGLDVANFSDPDAFKDPFGPDKGGFYPNFYQSPAYVWKSVPVPVIAALHGVAFGAGLQIALGADIRIAHPKTKMSVMEIEWGLIPDMAGSQTLRDLVRLDVVKELTFTGRIVTGDEAFDVGLVTSLHETPRDVALEMAAGIAKRNPDAIASAKYLLDQTRHGDHLAGLRTEEQLQKKILMSPNQMEAVKARVEERQPEFADRDITDFDDINFD